MLRIPRIWIAWRAVGSVRMQTPARQMDFGLGAILGGGLMGGCVLVFVVLGLLICFGHGFWVLD